MWWHLQFHHQAKKVIENNNGYLFQFKVELVNMATFIVFFSFFLQCEIGFIS